MLKAEQKQRLKKSVLTAGGIALCFVIYIAVYLITGQGIPCVFRVLTGLQCPGCGMTHAIGALLHLDFSGAFHYNPLCLSIVPLLLLYLLFRCIRYVKNGDSGFKIPEIVFLAACAVVCVFYFLYRNNFL